MAARDTEDSPLGAKGDGPEREAAGIGARTARPGEPGLDAVVPLDRTARPLPPLPYNKPFIAGKELFYIAKAVTNGNIAGDGEFTQRCGRLLEDQFAIGKVLLTPSCTAALEMAAMLCNLEPGDEVIMPSFTFVSTANAVARLGAVPVFVDIDPETLNLDQDQIEPAITGRTKAIFPVHYAGVACRMDRIMAIARKHDLLVVEDAAQGVNAYWNERALGSIGHLGTYSFHETKNYICGEGGALCINDASLIERAEIIRDKGTNRKQFFRGVVDKYTWVDVGSSYVPSEICSAFLYAQLEMMTSITENRRRQYHFYFNELSPLEDAGLLRLPRISEECRSNYHLFYILLPDPQLRDKLMAYMQHSGILAVFHYVPLHSSPMGQKLGYGDGDLPVTEDSSRRLLRLPLFHEMTIDEQARVVGEVRRFLGRAARKAPAA
jgi:dTDP-4-amino-4,6-dideoxygalactose transaminase